MLKESDIDQFYKDVDALELKFPVAAIAKATGARKGNVSDYLNKRKTPSENFIKKFYDNFPRSTKKEQIQVSVKDQLPIGGTIITLEDYLNEVKQQKNFLQQLLMKNADEVGINLKEVNASLSEVRETVEATWAKMSAAIDVSLKSLSRLEKKPEGSLIDEKDSVLRKDFLTPDTKDSPG